jgi:signal transduction histidine kinase
MKFSRVNTNAKIELGGQILTLKKNGKVCKYVEIYVEDNGYGISKEDKKKLFKLFGKIKQKNGLNKQGIGLGLNICKQICELFQGDIDVDSELGVGSRFFFKFLLKETPIIGEERVNFADHEEMNINIEDSGEN